MVAFSKARKKSRTKRKANRVIPRLKLMLARLNFLLPINLRFELDKSAVLLDSRCKDFRLSW